MSRYVSHWGVMFTARYILSSKKKDSGIEKYDTGNISTKDDIRT